MEPTGHAGPALTPQGRWKPLAGPHGTLGEGPGHKWWWNMTTHSDIRQPWHSLTAAPKVRLEQMCDKGTEWASKKNHEPQMFRVWHLLLAQAILLLNSVAFPPRHPRADNLNLPFPISNIAYLKYKQKLFGTQWEDNYLKIKTKQNLFTAL